MFAENLGNCLQEETVGRAACQDDGAPEREHGTETRAEEDS